MSVAAVSADLWDVLLTILGHGVRRFHPNKYAKLTVDSLAAITETEGIAGIAVGETVTGEDLTVHYHPEFVPAAGEVWWVRTDGGAWRAEDVVL